MTERALVVVSHPDARSLNHALAAAVASAWTAAGRVVQVVDLHAIGFDPIITSVEARGGAAADPIVCQQIKLLSQSSLIAVVHPNCWGSPPAMMKGWMDRIFVSEAAYSFAKGKDEGEAPLGLLRGKRALVVNTSNTIAERERDAFGDPLDRVWRDCLLGYCGFDYVDRRVYRVVATSSASDRLGWLEDVATAARDLAATGCHDDNGNNR